VGEGSKRFFFVKKNQKTFIRFGPDLSGQVRAKTNESLLLLFFRKEDLPFLGSQP